MNAEIITIGTELLLGQIVNSNAQYLAKKLNECGINLYYTTTVGDNWARVLEVLENTVKRSDIIITTGGLGPTMDDFTKEAIGKIFNVPLILHRKSLLHIEEFFQKRHSVMKKNNEKQALIPEGAKVIPNTQGTAPGIIFEQGNTIIISLPGVPREMIPMMEETVIPYILNKSQERNVTIKSKVLRTCGIGESALEELIQDLLKEQENPTIAPLAKTCEVHLRITARGKPDEINEMIKITENKLKERIGKYIYGYDQNTLEETVAKLAKNRNITISLAESCTGGLTSHLLTNVPGASTCFESSIVSYSNASKVQLLGVPEELIARDGAVSESVAKAMAKGARESGNSSIGASATGIAGPGGGTDEKPVGLVYIALDDGNKTICEEHRFPYNRQGNKEYTARTLLYLIYRYISGKEL